MTFAAATEPQPQPGMLAAAPSPWRAARIASIARSGTLRYAVRRLLIAIPVIWGVTFLTFILMNVLPGDAAEALLGIQATPAELHTEEVKLHLNEPFFTRYGTWLAHAVTGNLGTSFANSQPVASILGQRLPVTFELVVYTFVMMLVFSVPIAVIAARRPGGIIDRLSLVGSMTGLSIAPYVLALVLVLVMAVKLHWFPALGWTPPDQGFGKNLWCLTLPALALALPLACFYIRLLRADLLEQVQNEDYVVTARAKGLGPWKVLIRHALRNSLIGLITVIGLNVGFLIGSTVIVEEIFGLPGIGQELLLAIGNRDLPIIEGTVLIFAIVVVLANLATDLLYGVIDPRIRHGRAAS